MPIYEYECGDCGTRFELLVRAGDPVACPECGAADPRRLFSPVAPPLKLGLRGGPARRSNQQRRSREEQRREGFAAKREQRKQGGD